MRILGIVGSNVISGRGKPIKRRGGSFEKTAQGCHKILAQDGHKVENIFLREHNIVFCNHCEICDHEERCGKNDDFWPIYKKMKVADTIILFTPVTFGVMNPKLSALLLRAGRIAKIHGGKFVGKLSGTLTEEFTEGGDCVLTQLRIWFKMMKMLVPVESRILVDKQADGIKEGRDTLDSKRIESAQELSRKIITAIQTHSDSSGIAV